LAAFRMSFVATSILAALEDEAPLTEWALKMEVSIPDNSRKDFNHQAIDGLALWLLTKIRFLSHGMVGSLLLR